MEYSQDIARSLHYIETHLTDRLTAEAIAAEAGYSLFHFCRLFKAARGESLMQYVRRRRLHQSVWELCQGEKLPLVAQKYGFETASGFSRAFKREYGRTPGDYISMLNRSQAV